LNFFKDDIIRDDVINSETYIFKGLLHLFVSTFDRKRFSANPIPNPNYNPNPKAQ